MNAHPFADWLHDDPENDVFRSFLNDYIDRFPARSSRAEMRAIVEADDREIPSGAWRPLDLFDVAWQMYRPFCAAPDCKNAVGLASDWCIEHELEALL